MPTSATGIGVCSMGCAYCQARYGYYVMAERHARGETYASIAHSLGVTAQHIHQSIKKAKKYGWKAEE